MKLNPEPKGKKEMDFEMPKGKKTSFAYIVRKLKLLFLLRLGSWLIAQFVKRSILWKSSAPNGSTSCKLKNGMTVWAYVFSPDVKSDEMDAFLESTRKFRGSCFGKAPSIRQGTHPKQESLRESTRKIQDPAQAIPLRKIQGCQCP